MRGGRWGKAQPSTCVGSCLTTTSVVHLPESSCIQKNISVTCLTGSIVSELEDIIAGLVTCGA